MERNRRVGAITMVLAMVMAFAFLAVSDGWLANVDLIRTIMGVLTICLSKGPDPQYGWHGLVCLTELPTRYLLLLCLIAFGIGALLYRGFISLPSQQGWDQAPTTNAQKEGVVAEIAGNKRQHLPYLLGLGILVVVVLIAYAG